MDPRGLKVTQTTYFSLLTHAKHLSLVTFCETTAGIGKKWKCDVRTHKGRLSQFFVHSAIDMPLGDPGGSTDLGEPTEFKFLGYRCDHAVLKQLEAKNLLKRAKINTKCPVLRGFWFLVVLKLHGRIQNLKNRILWFLPDL